LSCYKFKLFILAFCCQPNWKSVTRLGQKSHICGICKYNITELFNIKWYLFKSTLSFSLKCLDKFYYLPILLSTSKIAPNMIIFPVGLSWKKNVKTKLLKKYTLFLWKDWRKHKNTWKPGCFWCHHRYWRWSKHIYLRWKEAI